MTGKFTQCGIALAVFAAAFWLSSGTHRTSEAPSEAPFVAPLEETHAAEAMKWYNAMRAYPTGSIPVDWRARAMEKIAGENLSKSSAAAGLLWSSVGPNNIGGRVRSIAVDPTNTSIIYAGSVSGGIWKTTDAGATWTPLTDNANNMVIGCIAISPADHNTIYAGTGEGYFNVDALRGAGVMKSTDGGSTWTLLTNFANPNASFGYYFINKLIVRPDSAHIVYAAMLGGIWKTTDAGGSWNKLNTNTQVSVRCTDLVADPTNPAVMYAAFGLFSTDGVYKTTNFGTSWSKVATNFPPITDKYIRISLGISPLSHLTLYASVADSLGYTHSIQKTTNGGASWFAVGTPTDPLVSSGNATHLGGQGWYNNVIVVSPADSNTLYAGGINVYKSTNGGASWSMLTNWYGGAGYPYVHADQHAIVFDPTNSAVMYFGDDGGVFRSANGGLSFLAINNNFITSQFYSGAVHPTSEIYYGGAQDNGTMKSGALPAWTVVLSGDGGATEVDFTTPTTVYGEYVYLCIQKSTNSGASWTKTMSGIPTSGGTQADGTSDRCSFIAPVAMDPSSSSTLVGGSYRVWRTTNGGTSWSAISVDLTGDGAGAVGDPGSTISALAIAKASSATIYAGTTGYTAISAVQVTTNTGSTWTNVTAAPLPDRSVTSIAIDPSNAMRAFVGFSGYNANTLASPGHVFLTTNRGASWTNASGNLPDIPVNAILIDPSNTSDIIVGTDLGVFQSTNSGTTWVQQNNGLANVSVADLDYRASDGALFAATHGRGMYKLALLTGVASGPAEVPKQFSLMQNYPNPFNPTTEIEFVVSGAGSAGGEAVPVKLQVYDVLGKEVATLVDERLAPGNHKVSWDAGSRPSGVYFYTLKAGANSETKKMTLIR